MPPEMFKMKVLSTLACAAFLSAASFAALAHPACRGRCPLPERQVVLAKCCCSAPAGWGWYLRQKLHSDCRAPLLVIDELGGAALVRDRR
jgi:hypothetical protein